MSRMRCLTSGRAALVTQRFLHQPSIAHFGPSDDGDSKRRISSPSLQRTSSFLPRTPFPNSSGIGLFQFAARSDFPVSTRFGPSSCRFLSTGNDRSGADIADLLSENAVEAIASSAPTAVANEVALAAADTIFPASLVPHFIDAIHCYTGFNWWSSIVIAALINRGVMLLPLNLYISNHALLVRRHNANKLKQVHQKLVWALQELLKFEVDNAPYEEMFKILNECFDLIARPLTVHLYKAPVHVCFFLGISNLAERVSSFKTGGASWFLDLSTPDSLYVFPLLVALSIWLSWKVKEISRDGKIAVMGPAGMVLGLLSIPCTMGIPKAVLIYWIAHVIFNNIFTSLEYVWLMKKGPIF